MIEQTASKEALEIISQIQKALPVFGKINTNSIAYVVPKENEKEIREWLDNEGLFFHLENNRAESTDFRIFIPEKYKKGKKQV